MSWVAHDPEGWTKICNRAIVDKICNTLIYYERSDMGVVEELIEYLADPTIDEKLRPAYDALLWWANDYIGGKEADYLITKAGGDR